jgi:phytoene synthase
LAIAESIEPLDPSSTGDAPVSAARRSSFYLAMRVLPREQRDAMYEIYGFCRAVDDIADGDGTSGSGDDNSRAARSIALNIWRARIDALYPGSPANAPAGVNLDGQPPTAPGLARAIADFDLHKDDFIAVIDGMQMDLDEDIQAPDFAVLDLYCDRVASAVGRLSTQVFGLPRPAGVKLAHHLGRALQFTNILRDVDEDAGINRLYLAREFLVNAGVTERTPAAVLASPGLAQACDTLARAAIVHYDEADAVMRRAPRTAVRAPRLMSVVYRDLLNKTIARGWTAPRTRASASRVKLLWLLLRHGLF